MPARSSADAGSTRRASPRRLPWAVPAAVAVLAAALWLQQPGPVALAACAVATLLAGVLTRLRHDRVGWRAGFVVSAAAFCVTAGVSQRTIGRLNSDWDAYASELRARALAAMRAELTTLAAELRGAAERALRTPADPARAAQELAALAGGRVAERGVVLYRGGAAAAWGGRVRIEPDTLQRPFGAAVSAFYLVLHAVAAREDGVAVAAATVHAEPPAGRLAPSLDRAVAERAGVAAFEFGPPQEAAGDTAFTFAPAGRPLFSVRTRPLVRGEVLLRVTEQARVRGAAALAVALICFTAALWRRRSELRVRLLALLVALGAIGIVPLNALSNVSQLFDPSFFYARLGGPYTASVGALGLSSGILLLALLAVLRSRIRFPSRWVALLAVVVIAGASPFLLRDLSRGITPPSWGVSLRLWLAWEVTLFLAAVSLLLAGASAGRAALGGQRGLSPTVAPALAGVAALLAPLILDESARWPGWYPGLWIVAIGALALTRRARGIVLAAAAVAAFGAATLVWGATARQRVQLAERDVEGLDAPDEYARDLLERFEVDLAARDAPASRAELLQRYVTSDLAAAGYLPRLTSWAPGAVMPSAELVMSPAAERAPAVADVVAEARARRAPVTRELPGAYGVQLVLAVPDERGAVTAVVVPPRSRLAPDDPFSTLLGLAPEAATEPPYTLSLVEADPAVARAAEALWGPRMRWVREGTELHGDRVVRIGERPTRAHVEVELRPYDVLVQRGMLVVLLDLGLVAALWTLSALADGGFGRWIRARGRGWSRSYRARLTLALFTFFVVPAVAFAAWSYRRLQGDDAQSRELLVLETLRAVTAANDFRELEAVSERLDTPLLLYEGGELRAASDTLYEALAPTGRFLPAGVFLRLGLGDEVTARSVERVGGLNALVGYRAVPGADGAEGRLILGAPARTNEVALDRRRRDLGVLVLFATALGALAALWLSGIAAREFARPIGALREAALAVAAGEREPALEGEPPSEFGQVFSAFRRMAADLDASRSALEEAQRRTAAVLRNVASGVVAVDSSGAVSLANPRAGALFGRALPPGAALAEVAPPEVVERVREFVRDAEPLLPAGVSGEMPAEEEEFDVQLDGRQLHARLTRLRRGGGGAVLTLDDVTELARAQRVLAWGEMARQVAHEIKNPLTPIRLGVQHLRRARADGRQDFDKILERNVERILAEIDRLDEIARAFSRYGTVPAERAAPAPTDVAAVTRDVVALERMGVGGVQWTLAGAEGPAFALARADELREVLLNVLENARLAKAAMVAVSLVRDDGRVRIAVRDDGHGIPADVLPRIFEPHFSTRTSGSGLGLAVSRRVIDSWGGEISVTSEVGEGTEVTITLVADGGPPAAA